MLVHMLGPFPGPLVSPRGPSLSYFGPSGLLDLVKAISKDRYYLPTGLSKKNSTNSVTKAGIRRLPIPKDYLVIKELQTDKMPRREAMQALNEIDVHG